MARAVINRICTMTWRLYVSQSNPLSTNKRRRRGAVVGLVDVVARVIGNQDKRLRRSVIGRTSHLCTSVKSDLGIRKLFRVAICVWYLPGLWKCIVDGIA